MLPKFLQLIPEYRDYVWGGDRLRPGVVPTAEAWVVYEKDRIDSSPAGQDLGELTVEYGPALLGQRVHKRSGERFPLLIKLIDSAQWLSVQVHPTDEQAIQIEGPGQLGKTEAHHILEAAPGAQMIAGLQSGTSQAEMENAIRKGDIQELVQYLDVQAGDTIYMPAGTIHAIGPGLLIYEVQEASDLTYRVYDWGRPPTGGRILHIDKSLAVANPDLHPQAQPLPPLTDGERISLCQSPYFTLEMLNAQTRDIHLNTAGETFHALTVIEGSAQLNAGNETIQLEKFETALIPAATRRYQIHPDRPFRLLKASVEEV